ncbi:2,4'-dihydroxyacetophenone dioxygenase family protein [Rhodococcus sp. NPDC019627]|uniref:2,4'-dihydroxyacetophenone dioxygenase family protein n=1 Tax=unclassified Rhodococcus (in: high G+C Gram-positive bacteria) TaxID=192944 RepID=UPI0033D92CAC
MTISTPGIINPSSTPAGFPEFLHIASDDFPEAEDWYGDHGVNFKLLFAHVEKAVFAVRIRFAAGVQLATHAHTGTVYAFTLKGSWRYLEYDDAPANTAGSFLFEPPGSRHTLKVADDAEETDVFFIIEGAMLILDDKQNVVAVFDAASTFRDYPEHLRAQGKPVPEVLYGGFTNYRS